MLIPRLVRVLSGALALTVGFAYHALHSAESTATILPAASIDPLRLTRDVEPLAQAIELSLDPAKDDFSGRVRVDLLVHQSTTAFRLHALGPTFTSATLADLAGRSLTLTAAITEADLGLVTLTAPAPIPPGTYTLMIVFKNTFNRAGVGLYKTISRGDPYLFTQLEARDARRACPCSG